MTVGVRILTLKRTHRALEDESWRLRQCRGEREVDESPDALHLRLERVQSDHKVDAPSWKTNNINIHILPPSQSATYHCG